MSGSFLLRPNHRSSPVPAVRPEVWWWLHEAVTRNHRCGSMQELIELTMRWLDERRFFRVHRHIYNPRYITETVGMVWRRLVMRHAVC